MGRKFNELEYGDLTNKIYEGDIYTPYNTIESLIGSPKEVKGSYNCSNNEIISLKYSPEIVYGDFYCNNNQLENLKDSPKEIKGNYDCSNNYLISLFIVKFNNSNNFNF